MENTTIKINDCTDNNKIIITVKGMNKFKFQIVIAKFFISIASLFCPIEIKSEIK